MATLKATLAMIIWSVAVGYGLVQLNVVEHYNNPIWALGTALFLVFALMVNVALFVKIGNGKHWEWKK